MDILKNAGKIAVVANIQRPVQSGAVPDEEAEFDSPETVEAIRAALERGGAETIILEADACLAENLKKEGVDFIFNIAEGRGGRDREAQVPALAALLGIPCSGSDALVMALTLDKAMCKRFAASFGLRTAQGWLAKPGEEDKIPPLAYPVLLKPNAEGSGKGITESCIAENETALRKKLSALFAHYGQEMLVETYLSGREFTVGLLGNGEEVQVFPPMEIVYRHPTQDGYFVYSYEIKKHYLSHVDYVCPAALSPKETRELTDAARTLYEALGCRDFARVDFRMDASGQPCFLELNPLPGIAPQYSDYPMAAEAAGYGYDALICAIAEAAIRRTVR